MMYLGKDRKKFWIRKVLFIPIFVAAGVFIFGTLLMYLWNAILPAVIGVQAITFWQAIGILILSKILFSGFHGRHGYRGHHDHGSAMREKWMNLTPEEKEKLRKKWWGKCEPDKAEE